MQLGRVWIRGSIMNQLPRGFVHNGESSRVKDEEHKGRYSHAWWWRERAYEYVCVHRCTRVSLLHTRDRHPPSSRIPCLVSSFLHECTAIVIHRSFLFFFYPALLSRSPGFSLRVLSLSPLTLFLFSYDNHPIQLCPFETMAQVRRSHA